MGPLDSSHMHPIQHNPMPNVSPSTNNPAPIVPIPTTPDPSITGAHHHGGGGHGKEQTVQAGQKVQRSEKSWKSHFSLMQKNLAMFNQKRVLKEEKKQITKEEKKIEDSTKKKEKDSSGKQKQKKQQPEEFEENSTEFMI